MTGEPDAVKQLMHRLRPLIVRYCRARLGRQRDAADDLAQDVCIAVLRALPAYQFIPGKPFIALVYRIASNAANDHYRAHTRSRIDLDAAVPDVPAQGSSPEHLAVTRADVGQAFALLDQLTPRQREIVVLRVMWELSAEEVGAALDPPMTPGNVRVTLHRALNRLRGLAAPAEGVA